jgi:hypothetical protein
MKTLLISLKRQHCNNVFNGKKPSNLEKDVLSLLIQ